jgi:hypothetical protein
MRKFLLSRLMNKYAQYDHASIGKILEVITDNGRRMILLSICCYHCWLVDESEALTAPDYIDLPGLPPFI